MMNEPNADYEQEPAPTAADEPRECSLRDEWPEPLTPEQWKILERMERKVAALGEQNRAILDQFHRRTGGRYVPERLYV